jgi:hypothetical protein
MAAGPLATGVGQFSASGGGILWSIMVSFRCRLLTTVVAFLGRRCECTQR